jgi:hypothetical protein
VIRRGRTAACLLIAATATACGVVPDIAGQRPSNDKAVPPIVHVLAGNGPNGPFRGVAYRTSDGWTCFEVLGSGSSTCGQGEQALLGTGWSTGGPAGGGMVMGGTEALGAAGVRAFLADGSFVTGSLAPVPPPISQSGISVYAVPLPPGGAPKHLDILDANGAVLEGVDF